MALKRALRLRKNSEFQRVRQQGQRIASPMLTLAWRQNDLSQLRIGFVVSKRISKHAVDRNHVKRLLSEAIRPSLAEIPAGWDIVLGAKKETLAADLRTLERDISVLLRRTRLLAPAHTRETNC